MYLDELVPELREGGFACRSEWVANGECATAFILIDQVWGNKLAIFRNGVEYNLVHEDIIANDWYRVYIGG